MHKLILLLILFIYFNQSSLAQSLRADTIEASTYVSSAEKSAKGKDYKTAIRKLDKALSIYMSHDLWEASMKVKIKLAFYEYKVGNESLAYQMLEDLIGVSLEQNPAPTLGQVLALQQKAKLLALDHRKEAAEETFALMNSLCEELFKDKASAERLNCLRDYAHFLEAAAKYDEAIVQVKAASEEALHLYGELDARFINLWEKVAVLHYNNEHYISCKNQAKRVLKIRQKANNGDSPDQYSLYFLLGKSYLYIGETANAKEIAEKALEICAENKDLNKAWAADFYQILADSYWQLEEFQKGIDLIQKKKKPIVAHLYGSSSPNVAEVYHSLGRYYTDWDKYDKAEENFTKAIRIYKALHEKGEALSMVYRNQAICFDQQGLYEEAITADMNAFLSNCPACKSLSLSEYYAQLNELVKGEMSLNPLATLFILQDQMQLLYYKYLEESDSYSLEKGEQILQVATWLTAELIQQRGETVDKELVYQTARSTYLWGIAILNELYKDKSSQKYLIEAFQLAEIDKSVRFEQHFHNVGTKHFGNIPDSLVQVERAAQISLVAAQKRYAESLLSKNEVRKTLHYNEYIKAKGLLTAAKMNLLKKYPAYKQLRANFDKIDLSAIQKELLDNNKLLIEYFVWGDIVYIFKVSTNQIECFETDLAGIPLQTYMDEIGQALADPLLMKRAPKVAWENLINISFELYETLLEPLLLQNPKKASQLIIIPDGYLYNLPFEVLLVEDARIDSVHYKGLNYLIKNYAISYQYTATAALAMHRLEKTYPEQIRMLIFESDYKMDISFDREKLILEKRLYVNSLDFGGALLNRIKNIFPSAVFRANKATEYQFKTSAKEADILHLSLFAQPDQSTILNGAVLFTEDGDISTTVECTACCTFGLRGCIW